MKTAVILGAIMIGLLGAGVARASWADYGFNSYDDCMAAVNDWASCNDGSQADPNADPPGMSIGGCTDQAALNFNGAATFNDGTCAYPAPPVELVPPPDCGANLELEFVPSGVIFFAGALQCVSSSGIATIGLRLELDRDGTVVAWVQQAASNQGYIGIGEAAYLCSYTTYGYSWKLDAYGYATDYRGQSTYMPPTGIGPVTYPCL